jgi:hypothetical protein
VKCYNRGETFVLTVHYVSQANTVNIDAPPLCYSALFSNAELESSVVRKGEKLVNVNKILTYFSQVCFRITALEGSERVQYLVIYF